MTGLDTTAQLIPHQTPAGAELCGYPAYGNANLTRSPLGAAREIRGGLAVLAAQLSWLPSTSNANVGACGNGEPLHPPNSYVVQLVYPGARVWVSIPSSLCGTVITNGKYAAVSNYYVGAAAATAYRTDNWPDTSQVLDPCQNLANGGRLGQGTEMAPAGPDKASICVDAKSRIIDSTESLAPLLKGLNSLSHEPSTGRCVGSGDGSYIITLQYRSGPPMQIQVSPHCQPSADNGSLQADVSPSLLTLLVTLTSH